MLAKICSPRVRSERRLRSAGIVEHVNSQKTLSEHGVVGPPRPKRARALEPSPSVSRLSRPKARKLTGSAIKAGDVLARLSLFGELGYAGLGWVRRKYTCVILLESHAISFCQLF